MAQRLVAEYSWLEQARVVRSAEPLDVAQQAAQLLAEIIREHKGSDIHLGFAGGGLVAETVRLLTGLLQTADELLVKRFIVHALVAAPHDPRRNPNRFLQWFLEPDLPFETTFVGLPAPAVVNWETLDALRSIEGIAEAFDRAHEIDIIVTSAGAHWDKGCSALRKLYETTARPETLHALDQAGCVGDILWQPLSTSGPIELGAGVRAVTVLDLAALRGFVGAGKRVILILAPCSSCHGPKPEVLSAVLRWEGAITDLVVDSRTAVDFLRSGSPERANSEA
ncbi:MAG: hypothetical protein NTV70_02545 [Acidobacteria bacterium]|nr:hypothetical protein [Acidobacteriota bacterium]